jgi:hypothetical protein
VKRHLPLVPEHARSTSHGTSGCGSTNTRIEGPPIVDTRVYMGGVLDPYWLDNGADGWTEGLSVIVLTSGKVGTEFVIRDPDVAAGLAHQLLDGAIRLRASLERNQWEAEKALGSG